MLFFLGYSLTFWPHFKFHVKVSSADTMTMAKGTPAATTAAARFLPLNGAFLILYESNQQYPKKTPDELVPKLSPRQSPGHARRGRGALYQPVGPRFPAVLSSARQGRRGVRHQTGLCVHGDGHNRRKQSSANVEETSRQDI